MIRLVGRSVMTTCPHPVLWCLLFLCLFIPSSFFFFGNSLLRYNSHIIQFIHQMCSIQWLLVYSPWWSMITVNFITWHRSSPEKLQICEKLLPIFRRMPNPWQPSICLSPWIRLFWMFQYKQNHTICALS